MVPLEVVQGVQEFIVGTVTTLLYYLFRSWAKAIGRPNPSSCISRACFKIKHSKKYHSESQYNLQAFRAAFDRAAPRF